MFLLDTNVISELRKARAGKADRNVVRWTRSVPAGGLFLSAIVVHELELGVLLAERRDSRAGAVLRAWLNDHVLPEFAERILPVDAAAARRGAAFHVPRPRPWRYALIAATAMIHGMTVVTRSRVDFEPLGVRLLNPWNDPPD
jgi:predicted nucleic acid-binding protein